MSAEAPPRPESLQKSMRSLTMLIQFAIPYAWHFLGVLVLVIIFNATSVLQPYLVKLAIDSDIATKNVHGLQTIALIYVGIVMVGAGANYAQVVLLQYAGQNIIQRIRMALFRNIESQSMAFFDNNAIGRLVTNVSNDTETVSQFFTQFFLSMVRDGLSILMVIIAMIQLSPAIAGESMIIIPVIFIISFLFRSRLRASYWAARTRLSNVIAFLAENLAGIRIIQIFHQERRQANALRERNESHRQANVQSYVTSVMFNRSLDFLGNVSVAAIVYVGGVQVLHHSLKFGTLYAFISYIRQFFQPINALTQQWNNLQSSSVAAERIARVLSVEPLVQDVPNPVDTATVQQVSGTLEFRAVSFAYKPTELVLRNISFTVPAGWLVGFVGPTGAGKSSIMSLLTRFYDPTEGHILLDGLDIKSYKQTDLHELIGIVQQDVYLFTGSVMDNIRLFRSDISAETVIESAKVVGAHEMIERLPRGYETLLIGKGSNLSMGERQLLSFARIVALNPRVLILDEATASLDSQTEEWVQQGLQAVSKNRTTLVIAHRLSTIRHADSIIVLQKGKIVEQGNHDTLLRLGGLYADLHAKSGIEMTQAGGLEESTNQRA